MSKALFGYLGGSDGELLAELTAWKARVRILEAELEAARAERDALAAAVDSALAAGDPARRRDTASGGLEPGATALGSSRTGARAGRASA